MRKCGFTIVLGFLSLVAARGAEPVFTVENKCPPAFAVVNLMPKTVYKTQTVLSTRAPIGPHTHTCSNNDCPIYKEFGVRETWDHFANTGHICPACKAEQLIQDPAKRPVTILRTVKVIDYAKTPVEARPPARPLGPPPLKQPEIQPAFRTVTAVQLPVFRTVQAGDCANGQCSTIQRQPSRFGFIR